MVVSMVDPKGASQAASMVAMMAEYSGGMTVETMDFCLDGMKVE